MSAIDRTPITRQDLNSLERRIKAELQAERSKRVLDGILYATVLVTVAAVLVVMFVVR